LNKDKARQPGRLGRLNFRPLKATFGSAPPPPPRDIREPLDADGRTLLEQLAGKLCLRMTARDFPHVINRLAPYGYQPAAMIENIDRFLINDRPNRQGFPFAVVAELSELRAFYARMPQY
jgi:hypothetical protein